MGTTFQQIPQRVYETLRKTPPAEFDPYRIYLYLKHLQSWEELRILLEAIEGMELEEVNRIERKRLEPTDPFEESREVVLKAREKKIENLQKLLEEIDTSDQNLFRQVIGAKVVDERVIKIRKELSDLFSLIKLEETLRTPDNISVKLQTWLKEFSQEAVKEGVWEVEERKNLLSYLNLPLVKEEEENPENREEKDNVRKIEAKALEETSEERGQKPTPYAVRRPSFEEALAFSRLLKDGSVRGEEALALLKISKVKVGNLQAYLHHKLYYALRPLLGEKFMKAYQRCLTRGESIRGCYEHTVNPRIEELERDIASLRSRIGDSNPFFWWRNAILYMEIALKEIQRGGLRGWKLYLERIHKPEEISKEAKAIFKATDSLEVKERMLDLIHLTAGGMKLNREDADFFLRQKISAYVERKYENAKKKLTEQLEELKKELKSANPETKEILLEEGKKLKKTLNRYEETPLDEILTQFKKGEIGFKDLKDKLSLGGELEKVLEKLEKSLEEEDGKLSVKGRLTMGGSLIYYETDGGIVVVNGRMVQRYEINPNEVYMEISEKHFVDLTNPVKTAKEYATLPQTLANMPREEKGRQPSPPSPSSSPEKPRKTIQTSKR